MPVAIVQALGSGSYNGMSWGPGTKVHIADIKGLGLPGIRASDSLKAFQHGHFRGVDLSAGRVLDIAYQLIGDDNPDFYNLCGALEIAVVPQQTNELPMLLFNSTRLINCRPRKRDPSYDSGFLPRQGKYDTQFVASDPRIYDANLTTLVIPLSVASGGAAWPWTWPVAWGSAGTSGVVNAVNSGSVATRPVAVITGPVDNPQLQNASTGQYVQFSISLGVSDTLTVDFDAHSVLLNGTASRRSTLTPGSQWWELAPGTTQILYSANTVLTGSIATITFRSAWM